MSRWTIANQNRVRSHEYLTDRAESGNAMILATTLALIEADIDDSQDALNLRVLADRLQYLSEKALRKADQCPQSVENFIMKNATEKVQ